MIFFYLGRVELMKGVSALNAGCLKNHQRVSANSSEEWNIFWIKQLNKSSIPACQLFNYFQLMFALTQIVICIKQHQLYKYNVQENIININFLRLDELGLSKK